MITKTERATIIADTTLGAGNVLHRVIAYGHPLDGEALWTDGTWTAPDGTRPERLTLGELHDTVKVYASWYHARGVRPRDPVAIQTFSSTEFAVNFLALTSLGAIPSFVNGKLRPEVAREYVRRQGVVGVLTDEAHREVFAGYLDELAFHFGVTAKDIGPGGSLPDEFPYAHDSTDPIIISHSSGTTGMPKAVPHTHETLLYAQLHRLKLSLGTSMSRLLVALPGSHNAAISVLLFGLLLRSPVYLQSSQLGGDVLDAAEKFKPTTIFGFSGTYAEMAAHDLSKRDLSSVEGWYNTGDAAHEAHVRALIAQGSHEWIDSEFTRVRMPGSVFTDGLGSSETGYSIFHNGHRPGSTSYNRCIGKPMSFAEAAVLSEDGKVLPPGEVGRLGVKSPTLTPGYWNDSLTFHRLRLGGYWLTGDLATQDEAGNFYHLDRAPDAIRTAGGLVLSTSTEELLLRELPELDDCTVVAVAPENVRADWDGDGVAEAYVLLQTTASRTDEEWTRVVNEALMKAGLPALARALVTDAGEVTKGATGKVLKRTLRERFRATTVSGERA
ncbi:class I adenylate-forming enzyme family protein [Amycolatopsis alba]|uniref:AMP-binding protein n=1 Tax=Amycolatopsis alba DSM 44262 TaxID=1125972 RepID=A0A229S801_AMYAL|nr:class I adenylate-forming enzyme family protein [Amycolatopsis alba]OXM54945.1 AMP-binding protein [Amycolatopsis alba DSM 44262]